ncbi:hypothetical protein J6590_061685 [Homalodisca vitripennis]|nr:hypothetical protein J6590_061685 [Homalodisca vitripennis]
MAVRKRCRKQYSSVISGRQLVYRDGVSSSLYHQPSREEDMRTELDMTNSCPPVDLYVAQFFRMES